MICKKGTILHFFTKKITQLKCHHWYYKYRGAQYNFDFFF